MIRFRDTPEVATLVDEEPVVNANPNVALMVFEQGTHLLSRHANRGNGSVSNKIESAEICYPDRPVLSDHDGSGAGWSRPLGVRKASDRKISKIVNPIGCGRPDYTVVAFVQIKDAVAR